MDKMIGLGSVLVSALATLDNGETLTEMELFRGSMTLIDEDKLLKINKYFSWMKTHQATGGPTGDATRAMVQLGAGTGFIGKINNDSYGRLFGESLLKHGAEANLLVPDILSSGVAPTFISLDGERTFGIYLGAASILKAEELSLEMSEEYTYLFVGGYLVQEHDIILRAIELAKEAGLQVCLDMVSYNIVAGDHKFFSLLINEYMDIAFANEEEAKVFTGKESEEALGIIAKMCGIAIVKVGVCDSLICKGMEEVYVEVVPAKNMVDTTGVGDFFAAGFLYGLTYGYSLEKCGNIGSILLGEAVQVIGTELPDSKWEKIEERIIMINQNI